MSELKTSILDAADTVVRGLMDTHDGKFNTKVLDAIDAGDLCALTALRCLEEQKER